RLPGETGTRQTMDPALVVHPVRMLPGPRDLIGRLRTRLLRPNRSPQGVHAEKPGGWAPPTQVAGWERFLFSLLWLPDDRQGFILTAWSKARELVRAGARLVFSTGPMFSHHLGALALRFESVRWVMEVRRPWADN